jgi:Spy/CpxP family protein refolding chaperone
MTVGEADMKLNYKIALIISLAFNLAFLGTLIYRTVDKKQHSRGRSGRERVSMQKWLELTPEQETMIQEIRNRFSPRYKITRGKMRKAREKNMAHFMNEKPDTLAIFNHVDEVGRLQAEMEKLVIRQMMQESEVLTPEQRDKFKKRVKERMGGRSRPYRRSSKSSDNCGPQKEQDKETKKEETP